MSDTRAAAPAPLVSVVIPCFRSARFLARSLGSVLAQSEPDLEVIVVDNASDDGTWELAQRLAATDPRVRLFRNQENLGPVRNWRRGLSEARGRYATLLFSDDWYDPAFLARALSLIGQGPDVGLVYSAVRIVEEDEALRPRGVTLSYQLPGPPLHPSHDYLVPMLQHFSFAHPVSPGCALARRDDLVRWLGAELPDPHQARYLAHGAGPDVWIYLQACLEYPRFGHLAEPLVSFSNSGGNLTFKPGVQLAYRLSLLAFLDQRRPPGIDLQAAWLTIWAGLRRDRRRAAVEERLGLSAWLRLGAAAVRQDLADASAEEAALERGQPVGGPPAEAAPITAGAPLASLAVLLLGPLGAPCPGLAAALEAARGGDLEVLLLAPPGTAVPAGARLVPADPLGQRGAALALAAEAARGGLLAVLHGDAEPTAGFLTPLLAAASRENVAVASSRLLEPAGQQRADGLVLTYGRPWPLSVTPQGDSTAHAGRRADLPVAAIADVAFALVRERLALLGGFDTGFRAGGATIDLCLRGGAAGLRTLVARTSVVAHRTGCEAWRGDEPLLSRRWLGRVPLYDADGLRGQAPAPGGERSPRSLVVPAGGLAGLPRFLETILSSTVEGDELLLATTADAGVVEYAGVLARDSRAAVRAFAATPGGAHPLASATAEALAAATHPRVAILHPGAAPARGLLDELSRFLDSRPDLPMVAFPAGRSGQAAMGRQPLMASIGTASPTAYFDPAPATLEAAARRAGGHAFIIS